MPKCWGLTYWCQKTARNLGIQSVWDYVFVEITSGTVDISAKITRNSPGGQWIQDSFHPRQLISPKSPKPKIWEQQKSTSASSNFCHDRLMQKRITLMHREQSYSSFAPTNQIDTLVQEGHYSSALAMELCLSCTNLSKFSHKFTTITSVTESKQIIHLNFSFGHISEWSHFFPHTINTSTGKF